MLPTSGSALLFGEPKLGKSYIALGLAEAIASVSTPSYLGFPIDQHGRVLYVQLDTPRTLWKANYVAKTAPGDDLWFVDRETPGLPPEFDIRLPEHREWLADEVARVQPVAVVMDTLRNSHTGDENDSLTMRMVVDGLTRATQPAALLVLSHQRKPGTGGDGSSSVTSARGSSALTGAVDAILQLTRKRLVVSARSDVPEDVRIYQTDTGFFSHQDDEERARTFLRRLAADMPERAKDAELAKFLDVSERTARNYRLKSMRSAT